MFYNLIQKRKLFLHTWFESYIIELYCRKAMEHCNQTIFASSVLGFFQILKQQYQSSEELVGQGRQGDKQ